jgi:radical SAM protein with 4Fe4S-binding SPASM domain
MITPFDYHKLQIRLAGKASRKNFPLKAMFELSYRCNLRCRHCYLLSSSAQMGTNQDDAQKELNTQEVFIILEQLAAAGCLNLGFTGGEPFLRKDFFEILEYAKDLGFNIIVFTNATLITPQKANRLKNIGVNKIDVSFHSSNREVYDWFTQVQGTTRRVLRGIKLLRDRGLEVYLKVVAMTINKDEMVKISHLAVERFGAHFRWGMLLTPAWDGTKQGLKFRLSASEINQLEEELGRDTEIEFEKLDPLEKKKRRPKRKKRRNSTSRRINHQRLFRCGAGRTEVAINPYGEMRLCMDIPEPKYQILQGSLAQGWKILSDYVKNTPPASTYQCRDCNLVQYCGFCPAGGWLERGDLSTCVPYLREIARLKKVKAERQDSRDRKCKTRCG